MDSRPRGYKTRVQSRTQNKAKWLAACGHVFATCSQAANHCALFWDREWTEFYNLEARWSFDQGTRLWYLSQQRAVKAQVSLRRFVRAFLTQSMCKYEETDQNSELNTRFNWLGSTLFPSCLLIHANCWNQACLLNNNLGGVSYI